MELVGKGKDSEGKEVDIPSAAVLVRRGPVFQVSVGVAAKIAEQLVQAGKAVPTPITGWGLVDTGSSVTCIDDKIAQKLGLPINDRVKLASASHDNTEKNVYPAEIVFIGVPIRVNVEAVGAVLDNQDLVALFGRDLLQSWTIFYNGIAGQITVSTA
jgi:predicted aspartyl protease